MRSAAGLTLLETIVAIALCAIVLGALATTSVTSLRTSRDGDHRIQATQLLDTVGRRVAGGNDAALLPAEDAPIEIGYGELGGFVELGSDAQAERFRVAVARAGTLRVGDTTTVRYRIDVCYRGAEAERCVRGTTLGRQRGSA